METRDDLLALAAQCVDGKATVYQFAQALADFRGEQVATVMCGPCADLQTSRQFLK